MSAKNFLRLEALFFAPWIWSVVDYEGALADLCLKDAALVLLCLTPLQHSQVISQRIGFFFRQAKKQQDFSLALNRLSIRLQIITRRHHILTPLNLLQVLQYLLRLLAWYVSLVTRIRTFLCLVCKVLALLSSVEEVRRWVILRIFKNNLTQGSECL